MESVKRLGREVLKDVSSSQACQREIECCFIIERSHACNIYIDSSKSSARITSGKTITNKQDMCAEKNETDLFTITSLCNG